MNTLSDSPARRIFHAAVFPSYHQGIYRVVFLFLASFFFITPYLFSETFSGEINQLKGTVEVLKAGKAQWFKAIEGMPVQEKDQLRTGVRSSCNIELDDGSLIFVDENTKTVIEALEITPEKHTSQISLLVGKILASVAKSRHTKMKVHTPIMVGAVRGTEFAVETSSSESHFGVFEGSVAVKGVEEASGTKEDEPNSSEVVVNANEETSASQGMKPKMPQKLQEVMLRNKERMESLRGRIQELRERLKRVPPEEIALARQRALDRFLQIKQERADFKEKNKQRLEEIRNKRQK